MHTTLLNHLNLSRIAREELARLNSRVPASEAEFHALLHHFDTATANNILNGWSIDEIVVKIGMSRFCVGELTPEDYDLRAAIMNRRRAGCYWDSK